MKRLHYIIPIISLILVTTNIHSQVHHDPTALALLKKLYPIPADLDTIMYYSDTGTGLFWRETLVNFSSSQGIDSSIVLTDSGKAFSYQYSYLQDSIYVLSHIHLKNGSAPYYHYSFDIDSVTGDVNNIIIQGDSNYFSFFFWAGAMVDFTYDTNSVLNQYVRHQFLTSYYNDLYYSAGRISKRVETISQSCGGDDPLHYNYHYVGNRLDSISIKSVTWDNQYQSYRGRERIFSDMTGRMKACLRSTNYYGWKDRSMIVYSGSLAPEHFLENNSSRLSEPEIQAGNFSVYPNPAKNLLQLESDFPVEHYHVMNLSGKIFMSGTSLTRTLNVEELLPGTYILRVYSEGSVYSSKFIKY